MEALRTLAGCHHSARVEQLVRRKWCAAGRPIRCGQTWKARQTESPESSTFGPFGCCAVFGGNGPPVGMSQVEYIAYAETHDDVLLHVSSGMISRYVRCSRYHLTAYSYQYVQNHASDRLQ